ncbi:MAG: triose-phosphate isomerase [Alphaproteobacteria bacterium]|nr:triose-phosphate isomerase [Alphaproteobacteria bacterium]
MPLIVSNWKMNGLGADGVALASAVAAKVKADPAKSREVAVCPPFTLLERVGAAIAGSGVGLGGQDCAPKASGAFTGDVSAPMLKDAGCFWVILGHSERRAGHKETDAQVRAKLEAAEAAGLATIACVGETLAEREAGKALEVVAGQLQGSLPDKRPGRWVVAYEPVWAIGTGKTATADDIKAMHAHIRSCLGRRHGGLAGLSVLYGGSVKGDNAREILGVPGVDGALVGGASLKAEEFWAICTARS